MKMYKDINLISELKPGDIVKSESSGLTYIVTVNYGMRATAVKTVDITNAIEWQVYRQKDMADFK